MTRLIIGGKITETWPAEHGEKPREHQVSQEEKMPGEIVVFISISQASDTDPNGITWGPTGIIKIPPLQLGMYKNCTLKHIQVGYA